MHSDLILRLASAGLEFRRFRKKLKLKKTQTQGNFGKKLKEFLEKLKDDVIVIK